MATIQSFEELVAALGSVVTKHDPIQALEEQGITVADTLKEKLAANPQSKRVTQQQRQRMLKRLQAPKFKNFPKQANFKIGTIPVPLIADELPEGEYDLIVGIKLDKVNQALASAFDTQAWPNAIKPNDAADIFPLQELRNFSDDIPASGDIQIGTLEFTSAPTTTAASEGRLIVNQPFELHVDLAPQGSPPVTVSTLKGTIRLHLPIEAQLERVSQKLRIIIGAQDPDLTISRINIDMDSDIQPRDEAALQQLSALVLTKLSNSIYVATLGGVPPVGDSLTLTPTIQLPIREGIDIHFQRADTQAVPTADNIGALMIGILIGKDPTPAPGTGSPDRLRQDHFANATDAANVYIRGHEVLLNKMVQDALASGLLERLAQESLPPDFSDQDVDVNSASVDLIAPNLIRLTMGAELVDFCGPGPVNFINLHFDAIVNIEVLSPFNGRLEFKVSEPDIDYSDADRVLCAISGLIDVFSLLFSFEAVDLVLKAINVLLSSEGDKVVGTSAVFNPQEYVPGTELLPRLEILQSNVTNESLEMLGKLELIPDNIHTFVYLRVVEVENMPLLFRSMLPIENADVQALDQDVPAPQSDDIKIPEPSERVFETDKIETTVVVHYEAPRFDELLDEGKTNSDGRVRLVFNPTTKGGMKVTTRTTILKNEPKDQPPTDQSPNGQPPNNPPNKKPQIHSYYEPIFEAKTDLFFRVTLPDGRVFDSRNLSGGLSLIINAGPGRIGQPEAPLILSMPHKAGDNTQKT